MGWNPRKTHREIGFPVFFSNKTPCGPSGKTEVDRAARAASQVDNVVKAVRRDLSCMEMQVRRLEDSKDLSPKR